MKCLLFDYPFLSSFIPVIDLQGDQDANDDQDDFSNSVRKVPADPAGFNKAATNFPEELDHGWISASMD